MKEQTGTRALRSDRRVPRWIDQYRQHWARRNGSAAVEWRDAALAQRADREATPTQRRFLSVREVLDQGDPEWLVDRIIPQDGLGQLYGPPGNMKSFVALDLALSVATGRDWMGRPVERGRVAYVAGEGAVGYKKRIDAYLKHHGVTEDQLKGFRLSNATVQLGSEDDVALFIQEAQAILAGHHPSFIVIDTQARATLGVEENSNSEMGRVIHALDQIRRETGATVLLVHHTGKAGERDRGASAVKGALDVQILQKRDSELRVEVQCLKQKDWEEFDAFYIDMLPTQGSLVPVQAGQGSEKGIQQAIESLEGNEELAFHTLANQELGMGWSEWKEATGLAGSSFNKVRRSLVKRGLVSQDDRVYRVRAPVSNEPNPEEVHRSTPL